MSDASAPGGGRQGGWRTLRLLSGLVLALFLATHVTNLTFGLASAHAMDEASFWLTGWWSNPVGNVLLAGALVLHFGLALQLLYRRRTLRLGGREFLQVALGLALPFLLVPHIVATKVVPGLVGRPLDFVHAVDSLWSLTPAAGGRQLVALAVAWLHGCLGMWIWLRPKPWYPRAAALLLALAVLVPFAGALGFVEAGRGLARLPPVPFAVPEAIARQGERIEAILFAVLGSAVAAVFVLRAARALVGRGRRLRIAYPDGRVAIVPVGSSILEASRAARIPHVSVCDGRGRCSTCRVRILKGRDTLPPPGEAERATLALIGAAEDVRLGCQLRPTHDVSVFPVFARPPGPTRGTFLAGPVPRAGGLEREIAVLFCDLRGFTRRSERALPYDIVHLLNRYFDVVGRAVEASGGYLDKFIGDGALALFGLDGPPEQACRQALEAAARIAQGLDILNESLREEGAEPIRIAMGMHVGLCIVGEIGFGRVRSLTAVGDGINVASRLESAAKEFDVAAVVSADLMRRAGAAPDLEVRALTVRGRSARLDAFLVGDATTLGTIDPSQAEEGDRIRR